MTRSGKGYKPIEKKVERAVEKEEVVREEDSDEPDDDLILEQLKKAKENLSIWELLMHSSSHRKNKQGVIIFSDTDLPVEGRNHNRALFIPTEVRKKRTSYVMVDDGSVINICPL